MLPYLLSSGQVDLNINKFISLLTAEKQTCFSSFMISTFVISIKIWGEVETWIDRLFWEVFRRICEAEPSFSIQILSSLEKICYSIIFINKYRVLEPYFWVAGKKLQSSNGHTDHSQKQKADDNHFGIAADRLLVGGETKTGY